MADSYALVERRLEELRMLFTSEELAQLDALLADAQRYREELENIANADPRKWDPEVRDQFQSWAQSRARHSLRGGPSRDTRSSGE